MLDNIITIPTIQQEAHQLVGQAKRRATTIRSKAVGGGILDGPFSLTSIMPTGVADVGISAWL